MIKNGANRYWHLKFFSAILILVILLGQPLSIILAAPASFFDTDLAQGKSRFREVVNESTNNTAVFYELSINSSSGNVFTVPGDDGISTAYVRATKDGSAINFDRAYSGQYYHGWSVGVSSWQDVIDEGVKFEFFADSGLTIPLPVNAFGVQTQDWGTCCTVSNYTPTGTAPGTAIYTIFDGGTAGQSIDLLGNITTTIGSTIHFVAEIDDRDETFTEVTVAPNGNGEAFRMGGYLIFSIVPEDSVPPGSGSTPSIPPERPDLTAATDLGTSNLDNLTSDTTPDFSVTYTPQNEIDFVNLYDGTTLIATSAAAGTTSETTVTLTSALLGEGTHVITAKVENGYWHDESDASQSLTITIDATPPTMTITAAEVSDGDTSNDPTLSLTFSSSESTITFNAGDVAVTNGSLSSFSGSGSTYTATLSPDADGDVTVNVAAGTYSDSAGNDNLAADEFNWTSDQTPPTVEFNPPDGATIVANEADIILTLSEPIRRSSDNVELNDTNIDAHITLKEVNASGADVPFDATIDSAKEVITINPTNPLVSNRLYYVSIGTSVEDYANNALADSNATFTSADENLPTLSASSPSDGLTGVGINTDLILYFSEPVFAQSGNIEIRHSSDDSLFESISVTGGQVSGNGTATITADITGPLSSLTGYYILIDETAFDDADSNSYQGIVSPSTLNFTTEYIDTTAPTVTFDPADGATDVSVSSNITLTFDEAVRNLDDSALTDSNVDALITLKDTDASGSDIPFDATIDVAKKVITINPTGNFTSEQVVYVAIGATVEDASDNAITATNATFTVEDVLAPTILSTTPVDEATSVDVDQDLVITFDEPVDVEFGTIKIFRSSDDSVFESMSVTSATQVSGGGTSTITINPSNTLEFLTSYYIQIDSTAFDDAVGNSFAGIADKTTWNFTTATDNDLFILGNSQVIDNGDITPSTTDDTDFGSTALFLGTVEHTFTLENRGSIDILLTGSPFVSVGGPHAADFTVTLQPVSPIASGESTTFIVEFDPSEAGIRTAEISIEYDDSPDPYLFTVQGTANTHDSDIDGVDDNVEGGGDRDSDGVPNYLDYDPTGYFYDRHDGKIISGGLVSVDGPGVVTIVENGENGFYQFTTDGTAGIYTMTVSLPPGYTWSKTCLQQDPPAFDPTGETEPVVLGNGEDGDTGYLTSNACTTFYLSFDLDAEDPVIFNNNLPLYLRPLPDTGFVPGQITVLDMQPAEKLYQHLGGMILEIPAIDVMTEIVGVPSVNGEWDVSWLGNSAGYLSGTAFPTWKGNTVITGHVWNSYNQPSVFVDLKELAYGDLIKIYAWGQVYTYKVQNNRLVSPYVPKSLLESKELDWVTIFTCEDYQPFRDRYTYRRMVQAVLISVRAAE